ncbi:MAG: envelope stress response membrane protein PspC [Pseudomonadota bacterium]
MTARYDYGERRFFRDTRNGKVSGVCAGIADYFGFSVTVTRVLAVFALIFGTAVTLFMYFGLTLLIPAKPTAPEQPRPEQRAFRHSLRAAPRATMTDVKRSLLRIDTRLAKLERYVTSPRYNLDREIREL